jgi:hypothetical protein
VAVVINPFDLVGRDVLYVVLAVCALLVFLVVFVAKGDP